MSESLQDLMQFAPFQQGNPELNEIMQNTYSFDEFAALSNIQLTADGFLPNGMIVTEDMLPPYMPQVKQEQVQKQPLIISTEAFCGEYNFDVFIDPHHGSKSPWVYSAAMEKLFILMNQSFPIDFKWTGASNLFVRATPVFSSAQNAHEVVERCIPHRMGTDKTNIDFQQHIWSHILRCQDSQTIYHMDPETNRLSLVVPLGQPQAGTDLVRHMFQFMCKNSCVTGMNRKPLEVVFTLEDAQRNILGRKTMNVRVCSCPKRDKEKDEKEYFKDGNRTSMAAVRGGKKRKLEKKPASFCDGTADLKDYEMNFKIVGKHNMKAILKYAHDLMAGDMMRNGHDQLYKRYMEDLTKKMNAPAPE